MNNCAFFSASILLFNLTLSSEKPNQQLAEIPSDSVSLDNLVRETFGAVILSNDLPKLSKEFCKHIISCAPEEVRIQAKLLINPKTRTAILPDNILLHGPTGSGKTTLGRVILEEIGAPFIIIKAGMLGNEYKDSRASGLRRIGLVLAKVKGNLLIDEVDCVATKKRINSSQEHEQEDETPQALWQLLDDMERIKGLFIGTTNALENMPDPLQSRFKGCLYEIPLVNHLSVRNEIVNFCLDGKKIDSEKTIQVFCEQTNGLSNREIRKAVQLAFKSALSRNQSSPLITNSDLNNALKKLGYDTKLLKRTKWNKKEAFNYTVQTISAIANIASIINMGISLNNNFKSLELAKNGLQNQINAMQYQEQGLEYQEKGLNLQEQGVQLQTEGIALQNRSVGFQEEGLRTQQESISLQKDGLNTQKKSLSYQKWTSNPVAFTFATCGKILDGSKWVGSKTWNGTMWVSNKSGITWIIKKII